ncbi:MAG: hypothetical protein WDN76_05890 [Alphaproteobacteria bacterium]
MRAPALGQASGSLDLALATGREAANIVSQMRDLARAAANGDDAARAGADQTFKALLQRYDQVVSGAVDAGATVLAGQNISLDVDPDAPPITVQGVDMRLKADPGAEDVLRLSSSASLADPTSAASAARDADSSLARIDIALSRLSGASQKLTAHDGFLGVLDKSGRQRRRARPGRGKRPIDRAASAPDSVEQPVLDRQCRAECAAVAVRRSLDGKFRRIGFVDLRRRYAGHHVHQRHDRCEDQRDQI